MYDQLQYPTKWARAMTRSHKAIVKVEVWNASTLLEQLPPAITTGAVSVDETRAVRRTCSLTMAVRGYPKDAWIPILESDLLHPASGNELRLYRGVDYQDGTLDYVPLGVFRMSKPKIVDNNGQLTIAISGNDRSYKISQTKWQQPYVIAAGTDLGSAIQAAVEFLMPNVVCNFTPTNPVPDLLVDLNVAAQTFGTNPASGNNPFGDLQKLAAAAGMELFFDVNGVCILREIINPTTQAMVKVWTEGPGCQMVAPFEKDLDETKEYNGALCIGNGNGGPPVQALAILGDPTNPIVWGGEWGEVPYIFETSAFPAPGQSNGDAIAQASSAAYAQLQLVCHSMENLTINSVPDPTVQEGDGVGVVREKMFNSTTPRGAVVSTMTIPLDFDKPMVSGTRPAIAAA